MTFLVVSSLYKCIDMNKTGVASICNMKGKEMKYTAIYDTERDLSERNPDVHLYCGVY